MLRSRSCFYPGIPRLRCGKRWWRRGCTPVGAHTPISPQSFARRVEAWSARTRGTIFQHLDFAAAMQLAGPDDLVYCDPPYSQSQTILYGAQAFSLSRLIEAITACKERGAKVALSIDGTKYSGRQLCHVDLPSGLFVREHYIDVGRSMLKRFQMDGRTLEGHAVKDRLLLTY